jgi:MYXO-CTERM domain-containing protein
MNLALRCSAILAFMATSQAQAAVLFQDATYRRINDTNYQAKDFGSTYSGSGYSGTLFFRWTMSNFDTDMGDGNSWFGLHLWNGSSEGMLAGKAAGGFTAYSGYAAGGAYLSPTGGSASTSFDLATASPESGQTYQQVRYLDLTTMVMRVDFNANARDLVTIFLNPDFGTDTAGQPSNIVTQRYYDAAFTRVMLREGGPTGTGLNFMNILIGETQADVGFTVVPAPGALALLGVAGLVGSRRRR